MSLPVVLCIYVALAVTGYVIGGLHPAYLFGRLRGIDIREHGSKNSGASNAMLTMGWRIGVLVGLLDILKGFVPVLVTMVLIRKFEVTDSLYLAPVIIGVATVVGHVYSYLMHFRGGKGFATFFGMAVALCPPFFVCMGLAIIIITWLSDYIVIATITSVVSFPIITYFMTHSWLTVVILLVASGLIFWKHIPNLKRIARGTEIGIRSNKKYRVEKTE